MNNFMVVSWLWDEIQFILSLLNIDSNFAILLEEIESVSSSIIKNASSCELI